MMTVKSIPRIQEGKREGMLGAKNEQSDRVASRRLMEQSPWAAIPFRLCARHRRSTEWGCHGFTGSKNINKITLSLAFPHELAGAHFGGGGQLRMVEPWGKK